jgi:hypothetical protein
MVRGEVHGWRQGYYTFCNSHDNCSLIHYSVAQAKRIDDATTTTINTKNLKAEVMK